VQRVIMRSNFHRATMTRAVVGFQGSRGSAPGFMRANDFASAGLARADAQNRLHVQAAIA